MGRAEEGRESKVGWEGERGGEGVGMEMETGADEGEREVGGGWRGREVGQVVVKLRVEKGRRGGVGEQWGMREGGLGCGEKKNLLNKSETRHEELSSEKHHQQQTICLYDLCQSGQIRADLRASLEILNQEGCFGQGNSCDPERPIRHHL